jgi:hypothetical protein
MTKKETRALGVIRPDKGMAINSMGVRQPSMDLSTDRPTPQTGPGVRQPVKPPKGK